MKKIKLVSSILILSMLMGLLSIGSVYANHNYCNSYFEDFSNPNVLGVNKTWSNTTAANFVDAGIENGALVDNDTSTSGTYVTFNGLETNGAFDCSFDLSMSFVNYSHANAQVTFAFNRDHVNSYYYALTFRNSSYNHTTGTTYSLGAKTVSLLKYTNGAVNVMDTKVYSQMPSNYSVTKKIHVDLKYSPDDGITVYCTDPSLDINDANRTQILFDNIKDTIGTQRYTRGRISIRDSVRSTFALDNFVLNNNSYTFKYPTYKYIDASNIEVQSAIYVPETFTSANVFSAIYDTFGNLVSVSEKSYTTADIVTADGVLKGNITHSDTVNTEGNPIGKVRVYMWDYPTDGTPFAKSREALLQE